MLFWALLASSQIQMQKFDGWEPSITCWNLRSLTKRPEPRHTETYLEKPKGNLHTLRETTLYRHWRCSGKRKMTVSAARKIVALGAWSHWRDNTEAHSFT